LDVPINEDIGAARIFSGEWGALFTQKKLIFSVVVLNTQVTTAKLTTPILQLSPPGKKFLKN